MKPSGIVMLTLGIALIGWLTVGGYGRALATSVWGGDNAKGGDDATIVPGPLPKKPDFDSPGRGHGGGGGGGGAW